MSEFLFINNHKDINPLGTQVDYELENKAKSFSASHKYNASLWNLKKFVSDGNSKLSANGQKTSIFLNDDM